MEQFFIGPRSPAPIYVSSLSETERGLWNFTDLTLADEATNSIPTDNANRTIQGNMAIQVTQPLEPMQEAPPDDQI